MHPRVLRTFLAVAREGSATRAARIVHLAQSSVSDQIQALEADLGAPLFIRSKRGLVLTSAGEVLRSHAEDILACVDDARAAVRETVTERTDSVVVGALETIAAVKIPPWLARFQVGRPEVRVRLKVAGSATLLRELGEGELDVVFCFDSGVRDDRFLIRRLSEEPLVLIGPPGLCAKDLGDFTSMDFVATEVGCVYRRMVEEAFTDLAAVPRIVAEVGSIEAIVRLVVAGAGCGLVPQVAVADRLGCGDCIALPWPGAAPTASFLAVWRRSRVARPALRHLLDAMDGLVVPIKSTDVLPPHEGSFLL